MTYIEFFDPAAIKNMVTTLAAPPQRVIFLGENGKLMKRHIVRYEQITCDRGWDVDFSFFTIPKRDIKKAVEIITNLVETYPDCLFDLTGGNENLILALGMVVAAHPDKNIQIHRVSLRSGVFNDLDMDGNLLPHTPPTLTVEENIRLYGGDVIYGHVDENATYHWHLDGEFLADVETMWNICRENPRNWNIQIGLFADMEAVGETSSDGLLTVAYREDLEEFLQEHNLNYRTNRPLVSALQKAGLITQYAESENAPAIVISYKNPQIKRCLTVAGLVLEMAVFSAALTATEKDGTPIYNDVENGVQIDWDGDFLPVEEDHVDTENEIDVMMMHGLIPVFVSCKNGLVSTDELYKLDTVAKRFGGPLAKKAIVTPSLLTYGDAGHYFRQRAKDMNITLIEDAHSLNHGEFVRKIKTLWS